jgi:hypothetical protein
MNTVKYFPLIFILLFAGDSGDGGGGLGVHAGGDGGPLPRQQSNKVDFRYSILHSKLR